MFCEKNKAVRDKIMMIVVMIDGYLLLWPARPLYSISINPTLFFGLAYYFFPGKSEQRRTPGCMTAIAQQLLYSVTVRNRTVLNLSVFSD